MWYPLLSVRCLRSPKSYEKTPDLRVTQETQEVGKLDSETAVWASGSVLVNFVRGERGRLPRTRERLCPGSGVVRAPGSSALRGRPRSQQREDKVMENVLIMTEKVDLGVLQQEKGFY